MTKLRKGYKPTKKRRELSDDRHYLFLAPLEMDFDRQEVIPYGSFLSGKEIKSIVYRKNIKDLAWGDFREPTAVCKETKNIVQICRAHTASLRGFSEGKVFQRVDEA